MNLMRLTGSLAAFPNSFRCTTRHLGFTAPLHLAINGAGQKDEEGRRAGDRREQLFAQQRRSIVSHAAMFTPELSALGGGLIGLAAVGNLLLNGRVLGISGAVRGIVWNDPVKDWRFAFLGGLLAMSPVLAYYMPGAFESMPPEFTLGRALIGGLLVGLGASMGNGCTSGHGICGNARFSLRSIAFTMGIMGSGALAASAFNSSAILGLAPTAPVYIPLPEAQVQQGLTLAATSVAAFFSLALAAKSVRNSGSVSSEEKSAARAESGGKLYQLEIAAGVAIGAVCAVGLAMSTMLQPTKVVSFLTPFAPSWNPSLAFVMGTALLVATPVYQLVMGRVGGCTPAPIAKPQIGEGYCLPPATAKPDAKLLSGALLFGTGWGLTGLCPGPALVVGGSQAWATSSSFVSAAMHGAPLAEAATSALGLAQPQFQVAVYLAAMVGGMAFEPVLTRTVAGWMEGQKGGGKALS